MNVQAGATQPGRNTSLVFIGVLIQRLGKWGWRAVKYLYNRNIEAIAGFRLIYINPNELPFFLL
jgi:hypothetical protein